MSNLPTYQGSCFCGAVKFQVSGDPAGMGYCHCTSCRRWSAGPINAFTLWAPDQVRVLEGVDAITAYSKTPASNRKWCKRCGGHLFTEHPHMGLTDVYAAVIPDFPFEPAVHVHYQETVLRMHDGVIKQRDLPEAAGGSGAELPA